MKNIRHSALLALTLLALTLVTQACGSEAGSADPVGSWQLDQQQFAQAMAQALIDAGKAEAGAKDQLAGALGSARFDLTLAADGTFTARQAILHQRHSYKGTWELSGTHLRLDQTHEDGQPKTDSIEGPLSGDEVMFRDEDEGIVVRYRMRRTATAAPGK